jgi:hypothetical protein
MPRGRCVIDLLLLLLLLGVGEVQVGVIRLGRHGCHAARVGGPSRGRGNYVVSLGMRSSDGGMAVGVAKRNDTSKTPFGELRIEKM